ncbi:hypothetical protein HK098_006759 [Nowakowskiella sp. JEL0407]|nr:hypothetical protein HK098_006759 [Nowakowskiella sp. JEL0407]
MASVNLPPILSSGSTTNVGGVQSRTKVKFYNNPHTKAEKRAEKSGNVELQSNSTKVNLQKDTASYRAERDITLHGFRDLMTIFQEASEGEGLTVDEFKKAFGTVLGNGLTEEQMMILFMKIDANTDNSIDWEEFSTFMLLRAEGQNSMREAEENSLFITDQQTRQHNRIQTPHKDIIKQILWIPSIKKFLTCSRDGMICYWSDKLKIQRVFKTIGNNIVPVTPENARIKINNNGSVPKVKKRQPQIRWIHDMIFMENVNKIATASDDHQISIYDFTTMNTEIRIDTEDSIPMCMDYWFDRENPDSKESILFFGTDSGFVNIFYIVNKAFFYAPTSKKEHCQKISIDSIPRTLPVYISNGFRVSSGFSYADTIVDITKGVGYLTRKRAHQEWCVKIQYIPQLHCIISCSPDPKNSLVIASQAGSRKWNYYSAPVHKGVNTFAFCKFPVTLVTGGTDKQLRLWNPHRIHHPMAALKGHNSPIIDIAINENNEQIISLSVDKVCKVWDIRKQQCIQTLFDSVQHRPEDFISRIYFGPVDLMTASTTLTVYSLKEKNVTVEIPKSHEHPLRCALYNSNFKQVVSGCEGSVVNVWDVTCGQKNFRFADLHGKAEITAMAFDIGKRRLITGGRDGSIYMWNFNNGQCLHSLVKKNNSEVTGLLYIDMKDDQFIVATGWNRRVIMFADDSDSFTLYPTQIWPEEWSEPLHTDDILTMSFCPPNILATGSFDGEIVLINLVSGHVIHRLRPPFYSKMRSIDKIVFLLERLNNKLGASMITTGADGILRWWNTDEGYLMFEVEGTLGKGNGIYAMCVNSANSLLITGDSQGFATVWNIKETCLDDKTPMGQEIISILYFWRCHMKSIVSVEIVEPQEMIITASTDCTVRLFTIRGEFVGTFSQPELWDLGIPETFQHPSKPYEIELSELEDMDDKDVAVEKLRRQKILASKARRNRGDTKKLNGAKNANQSYNQDEDQLSTVDEMSSLRQLSVLTKASSPGLKQDYSRSASIMDSEEYYRAISQTTNHELNQYFTQERAMLRTAELLQKSYQTKYATSIYAKERKSLIPVKRNIKIIKDRSPAKGVFHSLSPQELSDKILINPPQSIIGKKPTSETNNKP